MKTEHLKRSWLSNEEIVEKNEEILERTRNQKEAQKDAKSSEDKSIETKRFCKFCGKEIKQNSDYCELCSVKLEEEDKKVEEFDKLIDKLLLTEGFFEEIDKDKE
jgi:predicted nucleic acid-binding Zn ribbon protein